MSSWRWQSLTFMLGFGLSFAAYGCGERLWAAEPSAEKTATAPKNDSSPVDFDRDVRPIFEKACWDCHNHATWEGGLRLDRRDKVLAGGDGGKVVLPGESAASRLIQFVTTGIDDKRMPPDRDPLTAAEVAILRGWIDQGVKWGQQDAPDEPGRTHWSFQPIIAPPVPTNSSGTRIEHPVDAFIAEVLDKHAIQPSPAASRPELIRRLSLDLVGLLPTSQEVAEFEADTRPDAYGRLVDRLLASPRFGERWGRHWLDLARYADSDGYEKDLPRPHAYRYRDWVIDAFNRDLPFDQFTVEQLAGDLLPEASKEQLLATGFHRQTLTNREGGIDPKEDRDKQLVDRTNTTGAVWMGLTVGCAQCHTHKYDPISQREYFQLYAFFNGAQETEIPAPTTEEQDRYARLKAAHDERRQPHLDAIRHDRDTPLAQRLAEWEPHRQLAAWSLLEHNAPASKSGAGFQRLDDGSWLAQGETPANATDTVIWKAGRERPTALRLDVLPDDRLPERGPGRAKNGNFVLTELRLSAKLAGETKEAPARSIPIVAARADYAQGTGTDKVFDPQHVFDGSPKTGWAIGGAIGQPHSLLIELDWSAVPADADATVTIAMEQAYGGDHLLGRWRWQSTTATAPLWWEHEPAAIAALLDKPFAARTLDEQTRLLDHFATIDPLHRRLQRALADVDRQAPVPPVTKAMVFAESAKPVETRIHRRGDFLSPADPVEPAVLAILPPVQARGTMPDRLDLARWLVSEDHPLTRRVFVNRVWQHLFGKGLVDPPEDFGLRGTPPTHPELLDWLAADFSRQDWSIKSLIRTIVTSDTYQRSAQGRPDLVDIDPKNLWLARQNRLRLPGETIRDITLQVSGLLDDRLGGPSIRPALPAGVADLGYAGSVKWAESTGADRYRRGLYIFFQRTVPYPLLMTFDGPDANTTCQRRERSNTPLQSLTLLNDPAFVECAQVLGRHLQQQSPDSLSDRLRMLAEQALGRDPLPEEEAILFELYEQARQQFTDHPPEATAISGATGASTADIAATVVVTRMVLNLDEFFTRP